MEKTGLGRNKPSKEKLKKHDLLKVSDISSAKPEEDGFIYLDTKNAPFVLGGLIHPDDNCGEYYRLDASKKEIYSEANRGLAYHTAGGNVRFATDSELISIRVTLREGFGRMHHFADRGVYGIDNYIGTGTDRRYVGKMMQTFANSMEVNCETVALPSGVKEFEIELPLYAGITKLEVGFKKGDKLGAPTKRTFDPIAFYGSSITQGGCVSRPGNSYCNIVCRAFDADCVNYGFSGSAMGELSVAEHIATRKLSCFVMDYDYNSPSAETLRDTHEPFFKVIRAAQPELPVVFVTHPFYAEPTKGDLERISIVRQTYENAKENGDKNVYFVDSRDFFTKDLRDLYAVDNLHPNDLGQFSMAQHIAKAVAKALK